MSQNNYNPEYIKSMFNQMSGSYERINYITSFGFSIRWRKQLIKELKPTPEKVEVIDLMTGIGEMWGVIKRKFPQAKLSALDYSDEMIKRAEQKNETEYMGGVDLLHQNVLVSSLPSEHYDYVTCAFGLKTFNEEQIQVLAKEVERILKPNGQFAFIEVSEPKNRILKLLFGFYLGGIVPVLGALLLGGINEYKMLWRYTNKFKDASKSAQYFESVGLHVKKHSYFFGCATGFSGYKKLE
ncbi:class I SAM-dependent methyltransferase [Myroides odoratimimus]|uniref:class I SAM-dependent methyltransferase n=1 Tax=Myroides odoratimimus TaxID=76832 RepID=UPI002578B68D|nr:class I SAM-dependent methyltransferase [Myroides odoratimimus]MDM1396123.1 class I SAM-dependent methyltransferase [Myroides odoratimimus]